MFESPVRALTESQVEEMSLKYYNTDMHTAAFALPQFVKKVWLITVNSITGFTAIPSLIQYRCCSLLSE